MDLRDPDHYTDDRLTDMSDAELDLLIAAIGGLDEREEEAYRGVLGRATQLISDRREW